MSETSPKEAQDAFKKSEESFPAKTPDCPTMTCGDDCAKCQEDMKKALQGKAFENDIGKYPAKDLNNATITTFGELSAPYAEGAERQALQQRESDAIASTIFNRHNAASSGKRPAGSNFTPGSTPKTLGGVASAGSQYHGHGDGKAMLKKLTSRKMNKEECKRQCQRWRTAKKSVEKFASDPAALDQFNKENGTLYYNRASRQAGGMRTTDVSRGEVRIGGNDFSSIPMGTDAR